MRPIVLILLGICLLSVPARAQYNPDAIPRRAQESFDKAINELLESRDFAAGLHDLKAALNLYPGYVDALLSMGATYANLKEYDSSTWAYERARAIDTAYFRQSELPYARALAGSGRFSDALQAILAYEAIPNLSDRSKEFATERETDYRFGTQMETQQHLSKYVFAPRNLGDSVNSKESEYTPSVTLDGQTLIFTRRLEGDRERFFITHRLNDSTWTKAAPLPGNINTSYDEGAQNISQDGQMLVFTGCHWPNGMGSCDIYYSLHSNDGWSVPRNIGEPINSEFWESQPSLSPDKKDLYFAATGPDGFGGSDLWVSHRKPDGTWGVPQNLGKNINTAGDESCPFIHADNQTLFFTSSGLPGYGGTDLFVVRKDSTGNWGIPENLGYPINTIDNEGSLVVAADGKTAYYASDRSDSRGGLDLYTFELRDSLRPFRTLWVRGRVYDKKTGVGLLSSVNLTVIRGGEPIAQAQTDQDGNYLITLPVGKEYAFEVDHKGYLFYSQHFDLSRKVPDSTYVIDIPLQPLEANAHIVLNNIFFDTRHYDLKPESIVELDQIVALLKENPSLKVRISGHTDNVGQEKDNQILSNARAVSVVNYLVTHGIPSGRLEAKGYGSTQPVADNATEAGRAQNRRTELTVISD